MTEARESVLGDRITDVFVLHYSENLWHVPIL